MTKTSWRQPAEWIPHESTWLAWPCDRELWGETLDAAQAEFTELCKTILRGSDERVDLLVGNPVAKEEAQRALEGLNVHFHPCKYGDIWLRDTAPVFLRSENGRVAGIRFDFNGWGGKYVLPFDDQVSDHILRLSGKTSLLENFVLEGGAIEVDGEGTLITTVQCLLNPNRNPSLSKSQIEERLRRAFGVERILWLTEGLLNDHTDGHVDNIARFVAPGKVVCMAPVDEDPNARALEQIRRELCDFEVVTIPSPGTVTDEKGRVVPASYLNFYIANKTVSVPTYGTRYDKEAISLLGPLFPGREVVGLPARGLLSGGGAFHCITQQQPMEQA